VVKAEPTTRPGDRTLVLVDATVPLAAAVHGLGCRTVLVQRPGAPVHRMVGDRTGYYTTDFEDDAFTDFVDTVLRPLETTAVVSLTEAGAMAAATANSLLGTAGTRADVVKALSAATDGNVSGEGRRIRAHTFSRDGEHRWVAALREGHVPSLPAHVVPERCLSPEDHRAARAALTRLLDTAGLTDGPALVRLALHGGGARILSASNTTGDDDTEPIRRLTGFDLVRNSLEWPLDTGPAGPGREARR
jgi:hypothetical protein